MNKRNAAGFLLTLKRVIAYLFSFFPVLLPVTIICILLNAAVSSMPALFQQRIIALIELSWREGNWAAVSGQILRLVLLLVVLYVISLLAGFAYNYMMAIITQGSLMKFRERMFDGMQDLPISYFDTHNRGDIMSWTPCGKDLRKRVHC